MARVSARKPAVPQAAGREGASRKLVLVGFMGAEKSTAAQIAADLLGTDALDTDALLEQELGESIASHFEKRGEASFREHEESTVLRLLDEPETAVLALGGGAV